MRCQVGLSTVDISPPLPFPLGGIVVKGGRTAHEQRDPLCARAAIFTDGERRVALLSADLLVFPEEFTAAVRDRVGDLTLDELMLCATHTHSGPGGYWSTPTAEAFMGAYDPALFEHLVAGIATALRHAAEDVRPATLSYGQTDAPGLGWNRRHPDGDVDRTLSVLRIEREDGTHRIVSFGAHPVIMSERAPLVASADYPGEVVRALEERGGWAMFVMGPVGGVNVVFPEPIRDPDAHLGLVRDALLARVDEAERRAAPVGGAGIDGATVTRQVTIGTPRLFRRGLWPLDLALLPLRLWMRRFVVRGVGPHPDAPVTALRLGDVVYAGFPADLGPEIGLDGREVAEKRSLRLAVAASQTNAFVGYVHGPRAYEMPLVSGEDYRQMSIYENALGACGRDTGVGFVEQLGEVLGKLS